MNDRLKELRKDLGLSQEDFARRLGLKSRGKIANIEFGKIEADEEFIKLICSTYDVNFDWLMFGKGPMRPEISKEEEIAAIIGKVLKNENITYQKRIIQALSQMDEKELQSFAVLAESITKKKS